jgi:hypothetical protein
VILFFGVMSTGKTTIGVRHVLPVYPLLFILAARLVTVRIGPGWLMPLLVSVALIGTGLSVLRVAPHQLAYFNELVGGPEQGHRYLSDSNVDWGQDLKRLKQFLDRQGIPIIYLSYFGTAPPAYYGIRYQYVPGTWPLEWPPPPDQVPADLRPKLFAISVCNWQELATPYTPLFTWLRRRQPVTSIGYSIYVYDLTDDREALLHLSEAYWTMGLEEMARAEAQKVLTLEPSNARARDLLQR